MVDASELQTASKAFWFCVPGHRGHDQAAVMHYMQTVA